MKLGFIGTGNMASAIMGGIIKNQIIPANDIIGADVMEAGRERVKEQFKIQVTADNHEVINSSDIIILSVKPQFYAEVIAEIKDDVRENQIIITIAPGKTLAWLKEQFGKNVKIVRTMPNTPAMIGEGMTGVSVKQGELSGEEMDEIKKLFDACGKTEFIEERLMDAVVCASGSSPAFVYQFIEALADSAVRYGMPRKQAYVFAAQAVKGAAAMVLETGEHPAVLKDQVCSPAGTTIEGVAALEEYGLRNAVLKASEAVYNRCTKI
mgnify:CR=1 FL=1